MTVVRVGVRRTANGVEVKEPGEPGVEFSQEWVECNGIRLPEEWKIMRVDYEPAPPGKSPGAHLATVTITFACEGFRTVDHREPPPFQMTWPGETTTDPP